MKIIVCNIGSTSFKFHLLDMESETQLARGAAERIGAPQSRIQYWTAGSLSWSGEAALRSPREAVRHALDFLISGETPVLSSLAVINGVGFKTVQAGEKNGSVLLDDEVLAAMEEYQDLAPAHNPPYLAAIRMFRELLPETPLVGVFEPGFHLQVPDYARIYGTPWDWIETYGVRRYGYHGASHGYVAGEAVKILRLPPDDHRIVSCHLGGSSSLCAIRNGISIDTSMGFSPQSGLIQGARVGDLDPFVLPHIMRRKGITLEEALHECSRSGGLAGLSGTSGDMRDIRQAIRDGSPRARLALDKFIYDVKRYLGSYLVLLEGLDAVVFTGGIGQKDDELRAEVLSPLRFLGLRLDEAANRSHAQQISHPSSEIGALVIATNEELVVARETARVIGQ